MFLNGRNPYRYRCENIKHRENSRIESTSKSLRAARLKCIRSIADRVCLRLRSGSEVSSNYRGIQPSLPVSLRRTASDCLKRTGCEKKGKHEKKDRERERKREIDKENDIDGEKSKRNDSNGYPQRRHLETVDSRVARIDEIENSVKKIKEKRRAKAEM